MACGTEREAELVKEGWTRQSLLGEPRLSEAKALYEELGLEVHLEPVDPAACAADGGCTQCFEQPQEAAKYKVIFTRPR